MTVYLVVFLPKYGIVRVGQNHIYTPYMPVYLVIFLPKYGIVRVGQNHIYTPYMTVYLVIFLPKIPCTHRIYMVLANPRHSVSSPVF